MYRVVSKETNDYTLNILSIKSSGIKKTKWSLSVYRPYFGWNWFKLVELLGAAGLGSGERYWLPRLLVKYCNNTDPHHDTSLPPLVSCTLAMIASTNLFSFICPFPTSHPVDDDLFCLYQPRWTEKRMAEEKERLIPKRKMKADIQVVCEKRLWREECKCRSRR